MKGKYKGKLFILICNLLFSSQLACDNNLLILQVLKTKNRISNAEDKYKEGVRINCIFAVYYVM